MALNDKATDKLQDLIKINIDSYKGLEQAADTIERKDVADLFRNIADHRRTHAEQLRGVVELTDEEAEDSGSIKGTVHRWWLSARGAITDGDDHAVLSEAERGEDKIKNEYEEALNEIDDATTKELVARQFAEVKSGHDRVRDLRDAAAS